MGKKRAKNAYSPHSSDTSLDGQIKSLFDEEDEFVVFGTSLQDLINDAQNNGILEIEGGEYLESITIDKPLILKGKYSVSIIGKSHVVNIGSAGVTLENMNIECTDRGNVCLNIKKDCSPKFINVFVNSKVMGASEDDVLWELPQTALELMIYANSKSKNLIRISSPVDAKIFIISDVISINKSTLNKGINDIEIIVKEIDLNSYIVGELIIERENGLKRKISIYGNTFTNSPPIMGEMPVLWECISSLLVVKFEENVTFLANQPIEIPIEIVRSGSTNTKISFTDIPVGLTFNKVSMLLGAIYQHGYYQIKFQINSELIKKDFFINLTIIPLLPLSINIEANIDVIEKQKFSIPFDVVDHLNLDLKVELKSTTNQNVILKSDCLEGVIDAPNQHIDLSLIIIDKYKRRLCKEIRINVRPEKILNLKWLKESELIDFKNFEGNPFSEIIRAVVEEDNLIEVRHSICKGSTLPESYIYSKDGILTGFIDGNEYKFTIQAEINNRIITKNISIKTSIINRISFIPKDKALGGAFHNFKASNDVSENQIDITNDISQNKNAFEKYSNKKETSVSEGNENANKSVDLGKAFKKKNESFDQ